MPTTLSSIPVLLHQDWVQRNTSRRLFLNPTKSLCVVQRGIRSRYPTWRISVYSAYSHHLPSGASVVSSYLQATGDLRVPHRVPLGLPDPSTHTTVGHLFWRRIPQIAYFRPGTDFF